MEKPYTVDRTLLTAYLSNALTHPSRIKINGTLYLLFAYYSAAYQCEQEILPHKHLSDGYSPWLFEGSFVASLYGPFEQYTPLYILDDFPSTHIDRLFEEVPLLKSFVDHMIHQVDGLSDVQLVDRLHQDQVWFNAFHSTDHQMKNEDIRKEYIQYVQGCIE